MPAVAGEPRTETASTSEAIFPNLLTHAESDMQDSYCPHGHETQLSENEDYITPRQDITGPHFTEMLCLLPSRYRMTAIG